jgi:hypothetical protein
MREATREEYNRATSTPNAVKRHMPGKRCSTVDWSVCGKPVASKTEIITRGKVSSVSYQVNPEFLKG